MLDWISANGGTLAVLLVLLIVVGLCLRSLRRKKSACSCGGNCSACGACSACGSCKQH